ncbi:hypothetical protein [Levilactobacillus sp. HBUAS67488]|uniref:hypothetical protein n=1 Tax=Levilactobacillus sp. HBUAS67488 TaxID=3109361 RepID=UPI002FF11368
MLVEKGMAPIDFDNTDYYRMQQILQARSPKERPEDPMEMLKRIGLAPDKM